MTNFPVGVNGLGFGPGFVRLKGLGVIAMAPLMQKKAIETIMR
jgi:hypothetical protein